MTLTLNRHSRVIGSAHHLTLRDICVELNENGLNGSGDKDGTRNSRVNPMTLTCDLKSR